ncbi:hypothetical protein [Sphaerisporangium rubeum]|uniref:Uncharacterized protein n=1 Tax=Sphaerisporangium rubeum TaxID=321317 RepID=A0A7X0IK11_9ACTN|nr:hypothetical protein [Sphaerisporangium rubeum]MBB6476596.1 hypothetical protein [Sphaerisporangium rubeum]
MHARTRRHPPTRPPGRPPDGTAERAERRTAKRRAVSSAERRTAEHHPFGSAECRAAGHSGCRSDGTAERSAVLGPWWPAAQGRQKRRLRPHEP